MWLKLLQEKCGRNKPIYVKDMVEKLGVSPTYARTLLSKWEKEKKIRRYSRGIYYFPEKSKLFGESPFDSQQMVLDKYLGNEMSPIGYYTDFTLANMVGITTQVPAKTMIATNTEKAGRRREIKIGNNKIIISSPRKKVTKENVNILSLLDLISIANKYSELDTDETIKAVQKYAVSIKASWKQISSNIDAYPDKVSKELIRMRIYDVLT